MLSGASLQPLLNWPRLILLSKCAPIDGFQPFHAVAPRRGRKDQALRVRLGSLAEG